MQNANVGIASFQTRTLDSYCILHAVVSKRPRRTAQAHCRHLFSIVRSNRDRIFAFAPQACFLRLGDALKRDNPQLSFVAVDGLVSIRRCRRSCVYLESSLFSLLSCPTLSLLSFHPPFRCTNALCKIPLSQLQMLVSCILVVSRPERPPFS